MSDLYQSNVLSNSLWYLKVKKMPQKIYINLKIMQFQNYWLGGKSDSFQLTHVKIKNSRLLAKTA